MTIVLDNNEENMYLLEFLYNRELLTSEQFRIGISIKKAYEKIIGFDLSPKFSEKTEGGKMNNEKLLFIVNSRQKWVKILKKLKNEYEKKFLIKFICRETINMKELLKLYEYDDIENICYCCMTILENMTKR